MNIMRTASSCVHSITPGFRPVKLERLINFSLALPQIGLHPFRVQASHFGPKVPVGAFDRLFAN
jgi:hypothetical protein